MPKTPFLEPIAEQIWDRHYRWRENGTLRDRRVQDTWQRIAGALASVEPRDRAGWARRFYAALEAFKFLPGGRIYAGAGTRQRVTLFNCFVMGVIEDSIDGIFEALKAGALTMQQGGGVGYDFSTLRPRGTPARATGAVASGPVSFMHVWNAMCATLLSTGTRRGAMMATLRCDHPDIEAFINAKRRRGELDHFNLSVLVDDAFMAAVRADHDWCLVFPDTMLGATPQTGGNTVLRRWSGTPAPVPCRVVKRVPARALWQQIVRAAYDCAEPGVLFIDRINAWNNLWYAESISATNPCGEIPLPPFGACNLGSINLTAFVKHPFTDRASVDIDGLTRAVAMAVRMLDNVIDLSRYPLAQQAAVERERRRIGLGLTGLADALAMLGLHYGEPPARRTAAETLRAVCHAAYRSSIELAREKGCFPLFSRSRYLAGRFVQTLPEDIRRGIARYGLRNSHLIAIAPAGTISLLANNVSSGIEPMYGLTYDRHILQPDGRYRHYRVNSYAWRAWRARHDGPPPSHFVTAHALPPEAHLAMQAALQPYVDNAIAKTVNLPPTLSFASFQAIYEQAYDKGLKGCTTFRSTPARGAILSTRPEQTAPACCDQESEPG